MIKLPLGGDNMTDEEKAVATIDFLNKKAGRQFKHTKANKDIIVARIHEGYTAEDLAKVTLYKIREWNTNPKMSKYIRPMTIYNKNKFEAYLNEIEAEKAVNEASPDHSSLINQDYEETEDPEAQKEWQELRNRLEEIRKTYPKRAGKNDQQPVKPVYFDENAPFHLGTGDQRVDWNSYKDFAQEMLVRWDIQYSNQKAKEEAIMNALPESIRRKMK